MTGAAGESRGGQFVETGEVEGERGEQDGQGAHDDRVLKLERPSEGSAGGAQRDQGGAEREADGDDAGGIGERLAPRRCGRGSGAGESEGFQGQDGKHAGHDVEDQAAQHRAEESEQRRHADRPVTALLRSRP